MTSNDKIGYNWWIYQQIKAEIENKTRMSDDRIHELVLGILDRLDTRRLTIVPQYLTDDMFDAQKTMVPTLEFASASKLYLAALENYKNKDAPKNVTEEYIGDFW